MLFQSSFSAFKLADIPFFPNSFLIPFYISLALILVIRMEVSSAHFHFRFGDLNLVQFNLDNENKMRTVLQVAMDF